MIVAVIGSSSCSEEEARLAEAVGERLARRGAVVICGGLGGVMERVCRGARSEGGLTVGILPGEDPGVANQWVDIPIATGVGYGRNMAVVKSAQAVIAIGGNYGTLSEIAYALKSGIPVIGLNTWTLSRNGKEVDSIIRASTAAEAVDRAISLAEKGGREMDSWNLAQTIANRISSVLGKGANIKIKRWKQYITCSTNRGVLVWLIPCRGHVEVAKPKKSRKSNQTSEKIINVTGERDISIALEEIRKLYLERNSE